MFTSSAVGKSVPLYVSTVLKRQVDSMHFWAFQQSSSIYLYTYGLNNVLNNISSRVLQGYKCFYWQYSTEILTPLVSSL